MRKMFNIRGISPDDASALAEFFSSLSPRTAYFFCWYPYKLEEYARKFCTRKDITCFVATDGEKIVGYVWWEPNSSPLPILGICVRDAYQGNGIGKNLMRRIIEEAKEQGKQGLLLTVLGENKRAINLYRKFNFKTISTFYDSRGLAYQMRWLVNEGNEI